MSVIDWMLKQNALSRGLQSQEESRQRLPGQLEEQDIVNKMREQAMSQQGQAFPTQLDALKFQLSRAKEGVPYQDFERNTKLMGANPAGDLFVQQNPELAYQLFAQRSDSPSSPGEHTAENPGTIGGVEAGPPDLRAQAQRAANELYAGGSDTASKVSLEAQLFPYQKQLADIQGQWGLKQHQAGANNQMQVLAEKQKREAAGAAAAMINQSPANTAFQTFQEALTMVKDQKGAETLMKQMTAISNQLEQVGKNALSTGVAMGGDPMQLRMLIEEQINSMRRQLDEQYKQLLSKWYTNAPPTFGERAGSVASSMVPGFRAPANTEGYIP